MALKEYDFDKEPIVSVVKKILTDAIKMKATDIHFDPQQNDLIIKFRINGNLTEYTVAPDNVKVNIITRIKILANMNITESLIPQVGAITFDVEGTSTNMRVSSLPVADGEKIVVHISNYAKNIKSISKIGISKDDIAKIKQLLKEPQGIILITGTTASGKTTTMYSLLKELNSKSVNIISIEDPIKMKIEGINQVQIAPEKGLTYKTLLRNVLLQDPNIICINELIDDETTRNAIRAATTGRLVISTMHTKSAFKTIETLLNMDVENYLLGSNLNGIISQRLVKRLCPNCRTKKKTTEYEKTIIKHILGRNVDELYYPKGCTECQNGYTDQLPIVEVVPINEELSMAISNNKSRELIRNIIYEENNSILEDAFLKLIEGETSFDEVIRITDIKTDFTKDDEEIKNIILGNGEPLETKVKDETVSKEIDKTEVEEDDEKTETPEITPPKEEIKKVEEQKEKNYYDEVPTPTNEKEEKKNDNNEIIKALAALEKESEEKVEEKKKDKDIDETKDKAANEEESSDETETKEEKDETVKETKDKKKKDKDDTKDSKEAEQEENKTESSKENDDNKDDEKESDEEPTPEEETTEEDEDDSSIFDDDEDEDDFNYGKSYTIL